VGAVSPEQREERKKARRRLLSCSFGGRRKKEESFRYRHRSRHVAGPRIDADAVDRLRELGLYSNVLSSSPALSFRTDRNKQTNKRRRARAAKKKREK
jgi:hypothetical protein